MSAVEVLDGLDPIRKRPRMYVGELTDPNLGNRLLQEAMCGALYASLEGAVSTVRVRFLAGLEATIHDDGPGLSLDEHRSGKLLPEVLMTTLGACRAAKHRPDLAKGLCNAGLAVSNALSERAFLEVARGGALWRQDYARGKPTTSFRKIGSTEGTGTSLGFRFDSDILPDLRLDPAQFRVLARELEAEYPVNVIVESVDNGGAG